VVGENLSGNLFEGAATPCCFRGDPGGHVIGDPYV